MKSFNPIKQKRKETKNIINAKYTLTNLFDLKRMRIKNKVRNPKSPENIRIKFVVISLVSFKQTKLFNFCLRGIK